MTGRVVVPLVPREIWLRYCYNRMSAFTGNRIKTTPAYTWTCWECGKDGVLGVDLFFGPLPRLRNLTHQACWDALPADVRRERDARDTVIRLRMAERRMARNLLRGRNPLYFGDTSKDATP